MALPEPISVLTNRKLLSDVEEAFARLAENDALTQETYEQTIKDYLALYYPQISFRDIVPGLSTSERNEISRQQVWVTKARVLIHNHFTLEEIEKKNPVILESLGDGGYTPNMTLRETLTAAGDGAMEGVKNVGKQFTVAAQSFDFIGRNFLWLGIAGGLAVALFYFAPAYATPKKIAQAIRGK